MKSTTCVIDGESIDTLTVAGLIAALRHYPEDHPVVIERPAAYYHGISSDNMTLEEIGFTDRYVVVMDMI